MSFLNDTQKLHDFVTLSKREFLSLYKGISEGQYDYATAVYNII
ncbi:MAG: hypothetical protein SNI87_00360 [Rikenellaceae bacterium]